MANSALLNNGALQTIGKSLCKQSKPANHIHVAFRNFDSHHPLGDSPLYFKVWQFSRRSWTNICFSFECRSKKCGKSLKASQSKFPITLQTNAIESRSWIIKISAFGARLTWESYCLSSIDPGLGNERRFDTSVIAFYGKLRLKIYHEYERCSSTYAVRNLQKLLQQVKH